MGELRLGRIVTRTKGRGTKRQGTVLLHLHSGNTVTLALGADSFFLATIVIPKLSVAREFKNQVIFLVRGLGFEPSFIKFPEDDSCCLHKSKKCSTTS
jgi:hypothetical protein